MLYFGLIMPRSSYLVAEPRNVARRHVFGLASCLLIRAGAPDDRPYADRLLPEDDRN